MIKRLKTAAFLLFKATMRLTLFFGLFAMLVLFLPRFIFLLYAAPRTFPADNVPPQPVAIVFGAGLLRDGSASPILRDRVETAVELYRSGKVNKLLMSGDNRFVEYNEPEAMRQYALKLGVPDEDIILDYAGRRTYDTCYRAKEIFRVKSAILVTQNFHMARALYLCNIFGVESVGVEADGYYFRRISRLSWNVRETLAILGSIYDVNWRKPLPVLGQPEPIFPEE